MTLEPFLSNSSMQHRKVERLLSLVVRLILTFTFAWLALSPLSSSKDSIERQLSTFTPIVQLRKNDLPGDTGWARPEATDALFYSRVKKRLGQVLVNDQFRIELTCTQCGGHKAHFYGRMYGPAVLAGEVNQVSDGVYEVVFVPLDPGMYWVEIVLTFSDAPGFIDFPVEPRLEPQYEGYMLPEFPIPVSVSQQSLEVRPDRICTGQDLYIKHLFQGLTVGRWKLISRDENARTNESLGIVMDYQPRVCRLLEETSQLQSIPTKMHLILVGDSVMGQQATVMRELLPQIRISYVYTGGGLQTCLSHVIAQLSALASSAADKERIVLWNSGLHDIMILYQQMHNSTVENPYKTFRYRQELTELAQFIHGYPASLKIFQLTTAAWPKWGNWGFRWNKKMQPFCLSTHFVEHYNKIATHVLQDYSNQIKVLDAYFMTLSRPDNREINPEKGKRAKMAHPGNEVLSAIVRTFLTAVVDHVKSFNGVQGSETARGNIQAR